MKQHKLRSQDRQAVDQLKTRLQALTPILNMVVYGSRARGEASPESDLIEVPMLTRALRRQISEVAWEVGFEQDIVISTFVVTPQNVLEGPLGANPILKVIAEEGIAV